MPDVVDARPTLFIRRGLPRGWSFWIVLLLAVAAALPSSVAQSSSRERSEGAKQAAEPGSQPGTQPGTQPAPESVSEPGVEDLEAAARILGLGFDAGERELMLPGVKRNRASFEAIRGVEISNDVAPAVRFDPIPPGRTIEIASADPRFVAPSSVERPAGDEELAFASVADLGAMLRSGQVTSVELTELYLSRLREYGPELEFRVPLTEDLARKQAARADAELAAGKDRGPLHGIPYGAKDLLAVAGAPTTWGAKPYADQVIDETATVVARLEEAGAVLVAKLTLGALAWGDVWYGGMTRNPWNLEQGSSGSSAGSASATAAGLVAFAIGSETWGSIVSPSTRCGTTGLRPTFGRVSRAGAMALSWSMDKLGPIARSVEDCALVFDAIRGPDGIDRTCVDFPFPYDSEAPLEGIRVGWVESDFGRRASAADRASLERLRELGVELVPVSLPELPISALSFILNAEAAAAFDDLTRSGRDSLLVRQIEQAWPNVFRQSRFVPAVEYIRANRVRTLAMERMAEVFDRVDVYVAPSFSGNLLLTNLTGHPAVVLPNGLVRGRQPVSITLTGSLFGEAELLTVARHLQQATDFHRRYPDLAANVAAWRQAREDAGRDAGAEGGRR